MPTTTATPMLAGYPAYAHDVTTGRLQRIRQAAQTGRRGPSSAGAKLRRWEQRAYKLAQVIANAEPDGTDFAELAAALAERDLLQRFLPSLRNDVAAADAIARDTANEYARAVSDYQRALTVVSAYDRTRSLVGVSSSQDVERMRGQLVELAGPPAP